MVRTAKSVAKVMPEMVIAATLCCGCGICETLACCQGISPRAVIAEYKDLLAKKGMRFTAKEDVTVSEEREYRMIPSERWASVLGVARFDKLPVFKGENVDFERVEIALRQHIGAPSVAVVKDGDKVNRGDLIADSANGLSIPQHASIAGVVTIENGDKIRIDRVNYNV